MRTSFSYQNYPNIWDQILFYASPAVLRVVRLVDRDLRSAIDRRIRHLILTAGGIAVNGIHFAVCAAYDSAAGGITSAFPALRHVTSECPHACCELEEYAPAHKQLPLTSLTRTVDIRGVLHLHFRMHGMVHVFPRLDTLRLTQDREGRHFAFQPLDAHTLVLFPSPAGLQVCRDHKECKDLVDPSWGDDDESDDSDNPWAAEPAVWPAPPPRPAMLDGLLPVTENGEIRPGTKRVVVNFGGHVGNPASSFHCLYAPRTGVEEMVFVLPHLSSLRGKGKVIAANQHELVESMRSPTARHTVVGAECVGDGFAESVRAALKSLTCMITHPDVDYSIDDDLTRDMSPLNRSLYSARANVLREEKKLFAHALGVSEVLDPEMSLQQKVEGQLGRLEFLTVEEYRERVGDESAALHLIQYAGEQ